MGLIGAHNLQIAAAALSLGHELGTLNVLEFRRIPGLHVVNATPFQFP